MLRRIEDLGNHQSRNLKVSFPKWFVIFLSICGILTTSFFLSYIIWVIYHGQLASQMLRCAIFFSIILSGLWISLKVLFYSVTATERGLETDNIAGSNKLFLWDEIVEVRRPRFGVPIDFLYVISKNKDKLLLVRSMKNYKELIELIKALAPNLQKCRF